MVALTIKSRDFIWYFIVKGQVVVKIFVFNSFQPWKNKVWINFCWKFLCWEQALFIWNIPFDSIWKKCWDIFFIQYCGAATVPYQDAMQIASTIVVIGAPCMTELILSWRWSHFTTSRWPFFAAWSVAAVVLPALFVNKKPSENGKSRENFSWKSKIPPTFTTKIYEFHQISSQQVHGISFVT